MKEYLYILSYNGSSTTLGYNPAGWNKLGLTFMRHEVYHSVLRTFTLSLRFMNITHPTIGTGGYNIIQSAYNADGIFAEISIAIQKRNPDTNAYVTLYNGVLDLTPGKWSNDRDLFWEIGINDSSILQKFISRDENEIDLLSIKSLDSTSITPPSLSTINLPPVDIVVYTKGECIHDYTVDGNPLPENDVSNYKWYLHDPVYSLTQCTNASITGIDKIYENIDTETKVVSFNVDIVYYIFAICEASGAGSMTVKCTLNHYNSIDELQTTDYVTLFSEPTTSGLNYITKTGTNYLSKDDMNMVSGDYLTLEFHEISNFINGGGAVYILNDDVKHNNYTFSIKEVTRGLATTTAKHIKAFTAFNTSFAITTNQVNSLDSTIMDTGGDLENDAILNGLQIRNYPNPKVNIKFRDLFKTFDAINNLGLWFNSQTGKFEIEKKEHYFDNTYLMFDLGEVSKFKIQPYTNAYYSKIEGGYDNTGDYERVQGALEFAVNRQYSTKASVKETQDIKATYRCDSVGIEELRVLQYINTASEDNNSDNDIFIIRTNGSTPILPTIGSPLYLGMDVFYSYYNTMITPRQNAIRWGNVLQACHYRNPFAFQAQKTDKQYELAVDGIDENSDIAMSELGSALFIPELYQFENYLTPANIQILLTNPHGYIGFRYNGISYAGFINKIELGDYNSKANFELIAMDTSVDIRTFEDGSLHKFEDGTQKYGE